MAAGRGGWPQGDHASVDEPITKNIRTKRTGEVEPLEDSAGKLEEVGNGCGQGALYHL